MFIALRDRCQHLPFARVSRALSALVLSLTTSRNIDAAAPDRQKQVLILHSTRRDASITATLDRRVPSILSEGLGQTIDYYSEYLDQSRFHEPEYFRDFLARKYKDQRFNVVIAIQDAAVRFLAANRGALFPSTPLVFYANEPPPPLTNATGVAAPFDYVGSLALARALQPDLQHVFVVTGASRRDVTIEQWASTQLRPFERSLSFTYLSGLPMTDLENRLSNLPDRSAVYYLGLETDGAGHQFPPIDALERTVAAATAPTYAWTDSAMDHGVVGGTLVDATILGRTIGALALRILHGERADSIPVSSPNLGVRQVDARQLQRWHLSESRVPSGTVVRFKEPTAWDRYRPYITGTAVVVIAQAALIAGLVFQRIWRHRAEALARTSQQELQASSRRIRDLAGRLLRAQEAERSRIARELHDDIGQQLSLLTVDLELMRGLGAELPAEAEHVAREALTRAHSVAKSVHAVSHSLHPAKLRLIGLVAAITGLQREFSRPNLEISFEHDRVPDALPPEVTLCVFRIVQEALRNVVKHSAAGRVSLRLSSDEHVLVLTIEDDGIGFDVAEARNRGLGLVSMSERVEFIGGLLTIKSRRRQGTRLEVFIPYRDRTATDAPASDNTEFAQSGGGA